MIWDDNNGLREAWKQRKWLRHDFTKMALAKMKWQAPLSKPRANGDPPVLGRHASSGPRANGDPPGLWRRAISSFFVYTPFPPFLLHIQNIKHKNKNKNRMIIIIIMRSIFKLKSFQAGNVPNY